MTKPERDALVDQLVAGTTQAIRACLPINVERSHREVLTFEQCIGTLFRALIQEATRPRKGCGFEDMMRFDLLAIDLAAIGLDVVKHENPYPLEMLDIPPGGPLSARLRVALEAELPALIDKRVKGNRKAN